MNPPLQREGDHRRRRRDDPAPRLIVTADDFGASIAVNDGIERAHRDGILTCASLMVAGNAAADAVARVRAMPGLGVGLHLVLVEGRPVLPPADVPDLVDRDGRFRINMAAAGINFLRPKVRRQLAAEIEAQFDAFAATELPLDHVNAHKHFHLHPTVAALALAIGRRYGMRAMRAPIEPKTVLRRIEPVRAGIADRLATAYARRLARRLRRAGLAVPEHTFGLAWSGHMTAPRVRGILRHLPAGVCELYVHPAASDDWPGHAPGYDYRGELDALIDRQARRIVEESGVPLIRFADLEGGTA